MSVRLSKATNRFERQEGECYLGTLNVNGTLFHVQAIRVEEPGGYQEAVDDPYNRMAAVFEAGGEGYYEPVRIAGLPGKYVVFIYPYQR